MRLVQKRHSSVCTWLLELRASSANIGRRPKLSGHQQTEALERLAAGESYRAIVRISACATAPSPGWQSRRVCVMPIID
jgi:hypothetical protein